MRRRWVYLSVFAFALLLINLIAFFHQSVFPSFVDLANDRDRPLSMPGHVADWLGRRKDHLYLLPCLSLALVGIVDWATARWVGRPSGTGHNGDTSNDDMIVSQRIDRRMDDSLQLRRGHRMAVMETFARVFLMGLITLIYAWMIFGSLTELTKDLSLPLKFGPS